MSNGLDDLAGRRKRRKTPPPKHPRSEQPAPENAPTAPTEPEPAVETAPAPKAEATRRAQPPEPESPARSDATRAKRTPSVEAYLDQELMDWLWEVEAAAVARRERSVLSPAIRLALRELKARMAPDEVVDALLARSVDRRGRKGRPQR